MGCIPILRGFHHGLIHFFRDRPSSESRTGISVYHMTENLELWVSTNRNLQGVLWKVLAEENGSMIRPFWSGFRPFLPLRSWFLLCSGQFLTQQTADEIPWEKQEFLNFASYNYLGLASDERLKEVARETTDFSRKFSVILKNYTRRSVSENMRWDHADLEDFTARLTRTSMCD